MMFFEASAKNGNNVNEVFLISLKKISEKIEQEYYDFEDYCGIIRGRLSYKINKRKDRNKETVKSVNNGDIKCINLNNDKNLANKFIYLSKYINY